MSTTLLVPQPEAGAPVLQVPSPPCCARTGGRKVVLGRNSVGISACKVLHCRRGERAPGSLKVTQDSGKQQNSATQDLAAPQRT